MLTVFITFGILLVIGMPVAFAIGISSFIFFFMDPILQSFMAPQIIVSGTQDFTLLAIPMFIFAGNLLNGTGITKRLISLAKVLSGHMYGYIAQTSVVLSTLMGGVSGSAIADSAMQARILGPQFDKEGYSKGYAASVIGYSALICVTVPPGIGLVLYGSIGQVSIGKLFTAGIIPGLLMMTVLMIVVAITARKKGYKPKREKMASPKEIAPVLAKSIWALVFPIILIVGLRFGLLTPAEAGSFASVYALFVGLIAYRELTWKKFKNTITSTLTDVGMIMFLIAMSGLLSKDITWVRLPQTLAQFLLGISNNPRILMLIILTFLFFLAMLIDSTVIILLVTSILVPVIDQVGGNLVHFGVVMVMTCAIGLLTPPVGVAMYSLCNIVKCPSDEFLNEALPFLGGILLLIIFLVLFPQVVLFLPNLIF